MFHPDIAAAFEVVPDNVTAGHTKDSEGNFVAPSVEATPTVTVEVNLSEGEISWQSSPVQSVKQLLQHALAMLI